MEKPNVRFAFLPTEMTARFEMTSPVGQRCILQYMLPWLANIELVDLSNSSPTPPELNIETDEEEQTSAMSPVELEGEGWGSVEATQLVLNNLFYITVKVSHFWIEGWFRNKYSLAKHMNMKNIAYLCLIANQSISKGQLTFASVSEWDPVLTSSFSCQSISFTY